MGRVRFGLYLPQMRMPYDTILERVQIAERAGFDSVWLMDHFAPPMAVEQPSLEGWTLASALAARTETIRLGHLVLCASYRHPALLAKMAATLDVISGGRLELGLGWGSCEDEMRRCGTYEPPRRRAERLAETLAILEGLFTGDFFTYHGEHYQLEEAVCRPTPVQPRIPIHLGGKGRKLTLPLVRRYADWWNCPPYGVDEFDDLRRHAGAVRISVQRPIGLVVDEARRDDTLAVAQRRFGWWGGLVSGSAQEVVAALEADVERGVELFVCQFSDFATPETIECFAAEVIPRLTQATLMHN